MLYLRICFDKQDTSIRAQALKGHREYIASYLAGRDDIKVVQGGPMCLDDDLSKNVGSFLVIEAPSLEAAERFHNNDPFSQAGLFERADVVRWDRHIGNPDQAEYVP